MTNEVLINAMRPGSRNPLDIREDKDLGRFGLGLKTASFSQCKKFSVISKTKDGDPSFWCWDLEFVKNVAKTWTLINYYPDKSIFQKINNSVKGTAVIWWDIDRMTKGTSSESPEAMDKFMRTMDGVKKHL